MRMALVACLIAICSCAPSPPQTAKTTAKPSAPPAAEPPPPPPITGLPASFTLKQRSQIDLPGTAGALKLSIGDITGGKVQTSIGNDNDFSLQPVFLSQGDRKTFEYQKRSYDLTLAELNNALIGEDFATFKLAESPVAEAPAGAALNEAEKIDRLIARVASLEGATFIRNGSDHSPAEAARHLGEKREHARDKLKTAEQFIEHVASRSSLSGEDYAIRFDDGRVVKAGTFLREELKKLAPKEPPAEAPDKP